MDKRDGVPTYNLLERRFTQEISGAIRASPGGGDGGGGGDGCLFWRRIWISRWAGTCPIISPDPRLIGWSSGHAAFTDPRPDRACCAFLFSPCTKEQKGFCSCGRLRLSRHAVCAVTGAEEDRQQRGHREGIIVFYFSLYMTSLLVSSR